MFTLYFLLLSLAIATDGLPEALYQSKRQIALPTITASQPLAGSPFIGAPIPPKAIKPKAIYDPDASLMHIDGGNTGRIDLPGPLCSEISMTTYATQIAPFLWDTQAHLTTGGVVIPPNSAKPTSTLCAVEPGGFARGSGTTPTLLGHEYVAVTDNANHQIHMLIYSQHPAPYQEPLVYRIPIFARGASACDVGAIGHVSADGVYSTMALNDYNAPNIYFGTGVINGGFDNLTRMAPDGVRIEVKPDDSGCAIGWDNPNRFTFVLILSTSTGLLYAYTQDEALAYEGKYVCYQGLQ